ncbi:MAG: hypothetical protein M0R03_16930 [Novosphingobium sp.]|nr:hypothetical protein [Novosphingobium sp.]
MKFNSTRNKLNTIWNDNQENTNNVDKISVVNKDFNSFNFKKKVTKINLIDDQLSISGDIIYITKQLENISEKNIPFINVILKTRFNEDYTREEIDSPYATHNISLSNVWLKYGFTKIEDSAYDLDISYKALAQLFTKHPLGYSYSNIPLYITVDICFLNTNSYFTTQSEG